MCKCIISCVKPAGNCLVAVDLLAVEIVFWNIAPSAGRQSNRQEHAMLLQLSVLYHMTNDYIFTRTLFTAMVLRKLYFVPKIKTF